MDTTNFVRLCHSLPYLSLVAIHSELDFRVSDAEGWLKERQNSNPEWERRTKACIVILGRKRDMVAGRLRSIESLSMASLSRGRGNGAVFLRSDPAARSKFLLGIVEKLVDPAELDDEERIALSICRDASRDNAG